MSQNLQNFVTFQTFQLENLADFEKCCKTHIYLQKSVPIQPKTSNILPKFCQTNERPFSYQPLSAPPAAPQSSPPGAAPRMGWTGIFLPSKLTRLKHWNGQRDSSRQLVNDTLYYLGFFSLIQPSTDPSNVFCFIIIENERNSEFGIHEQ